MDRNRGAREATAGPRTDSAGPVPVLDITVLAGGPGAERAVSLRSGAAVSAALMRLGHRVRRLDIAPDDLSALDAPAEVLFIALHGEFGEDGTLQALLDARGLCYTGSGAAASRRAMDKEAAKLVFQGAGIPTPEFVIAQGGNAAETCRRFGGPAVVKPCGAGSSVDTTIAQSVEELVSAAVDVAGRYGRALIERYIRGPELTVGIVGDRALPVCEIRPCRSFYDYTAKYHDDGTQYLFDSDLPGGLLQAVQAYSLAAHEALGCRVFSRADWMVDAETGEPFLLEVNTIPGFTDHSLLPKAAAVAGIGFDQLCQEIVSRSLDACCERHSTGGPVTNARMDRNSRLGRVRVAQL